MERCQLCHRVKTWVLDAGRIVLKCAFCVALIFSGEPEVPNRAAIDAALAYPNNVTYSVPSTSAYPAPFPGAQTDASTASRAHTDPLNELWSATPDALVGKWLEDPAKRGG